jgi:mRNA interferase RelE/StbE
MLRPILSKQAGKFLEAIPIKHARQIVGKIDALCTDYEATPTEELKGFAPFRRLKSGEYRIVFLVEGDQMQITLIGKRNDDDIYKQIARFMRG